MFRKADRLNAGSLRLAKGAVVATLTLLMLYTASANTLARCVDGYHPCPTINISCPTDQLIPGTPATVSVKLSGGDPNIPVTYNWTVSDGTITGGQGTPSIIIDTTGLGAGLAEQKITATVEIGGLPSECDRARNCSFLITPIIDPACTKFDEYSDLKFNDEKARLDNFAIQLQQQPGSQGYYVIFGSCEAEKEQHSQRVVNYLVNKRDIDRNRITIIDAGCRETLTAELWICPTGAGAPTPNNMATVNPCPVCKAKPKARRRVRRRGRHLNSR
jgi:hypothetical protein